MPIYEYRCAACGASTEFLVGVSAGTEPAALRCESCGGAELSRLMSRINIGASAASCTGPCGSACSPQAMSSGGCCGGSCHGH